MNVSFFVAEVDGKFYSIFNPEIIRASKKLGEMEEGCLSVPNNFGLVRRADKIWLTGFNADGKKIQIKAFGFLARVFQHEMDHLKGVLFTDKCEDLRIILPPSP
jgi:peptide deformylase